MKIFKNINKNLVKILSAIVFILSTINLTLNAVFCMDIIRSEASTLTQGDYSFLNNMYDEAYIKLKKYDKSLYRVEKTYMVSSCDGLVFNTNSISFSSSTYSKETHKFLEKLGIKSSHVHVTYNPDCTKAVDMLLGIKYLAIFQNHEIVKNYNKEDYFENKIKLLKNPYSLSLGYCVNKEILYTNDENDNTFEFQNNILKNMTGLEEDVYKMHEGKIKNTAQGLSNNQEVYIKTDDESKIVYEFKIEHENNAYVYILAVNDEKAELYINGEKLKNHELIQENEMINLGKREIGEKIKVEIVPKGDIIINNIFVAYEDEEILKKYYNILNKEQVNIEKISNTKYKGKVSVSDNEKQVLFTIPYDEGWKIKVDGKEVMQEKAFDALISFKIDRGEHEIILEFNPPKISIGFFVSIFGVLIYSLYQIIDRKNNNK